MDQTHDRPDFIIKKTEEIYIEAVVSNIKAKGVPEKERGMEDIMSMFMPPYEQTDYYSILDEAIIRQANAILSKRNKFIENYVNCDWINNEKPYVVALSSYDQINYGREYIYPMMALLYGMYYCPEKEEYEIRDSIKKVETGVDIPIGIFNNPDYADISAILYTSTVTIGKISSLNISNGRYSINNVYSLYRDYNDIKVPYKLNIVSPQSPEYLSDGIFIFHNPNAKNRLSLDYFADLNITQYYSVEDGIEYLTNSPTLVVRTDFPRFLSDGFDLLISEYTRHYNKLGMKEFYGYQPLDGSPKEVKDIDFMNDCCVFIISQDNGIDRDENNVLVCNYERPTVMPDEMIHNEAIRITDELQKEAKIGELIGIYVARNHSQYAYINNFIDEKNPRGQISTFCIYSKNLVDYSIYIS
ncbi:hypothetical protein GC105_10125 [Alkalibaculum sp. M08DMB]|uniref:Uncharacterized protein n=1 Tax=Alkalibaculum sporogenes TaxID=2655001 RepID=A0A6A7K9V9_9FIRM|nr:hypothetical protein [Alkalibaculum sporogenes]MPW26145.1 hypothetical protein [Alkalibaculum sporogenes]